MRVLLDLDGTLTDPQEGFVSCIRHALIQLSRTPGPDTDIASHIGPPLEQTLELLLGGTQDVDKAVRFYRERYSSIGIYENRMYPGVPEALQRLSQSCPLYLATSKPRVFAIRILEHFGLSRFFESVHGSELDGRRSDKGELIAHLLAEERIDPRSAVMVGDRSHDVRGAAKNGVVAVGVLWGYGSRQELESAGARLLIDSVEALGHLASNIALQRAS